MSLLITMIFKNGGSEVEDMIIIRERDSFREPSNARGKCECGCEMELPLESRMYYACPNCKKRYDADGNLEVEDE